MATFVKLQELVDAVVKKFQLPPTAITVTTENRLEDEDIKKLGDLGDKVKELTSNGVTKDDVTYGRNPKVFELTSKIKSAGDVHVNILEPANNKLFMVESKIEIPTSDTSSDNKVEINNSVYDTDAERTVQNIKAEIENLKKTLKALQDAIANATENTKRIERVTVTDNPETLGLRRVAPDDIAKKLEANVELVYIGDDRSTVYEKTKEVTLHPYVPPKSSPRELKFDKDNHVDASKTLSELTDLAGDDKTIERYSLYDALDYIEDLIPGKNGLRYNDETVYKTEENGRTIYVVLKSKEAIFDRKNNVDISTSIDGLQQPPEGKVLSGKKTLKEVTDMKGDPSNPYTGKLHKVSEGSDAGYYVEVPRELTPEEQFDQANNVIKVSSKVNADNNARTSGKDLENNKYETLDEVRRAFNEKNTSEGLYTIYKVMNDYDNNGYYLARKLTEDEIEERILAVQDLEDTDKSDDIPNLTEGKYKTSTLRNKRDEYYEVTDPDWLKVPYYANAIKIKPKDFDDNHVYFIKKNSADGNEYFEYPYHGSAVMALDEKIIAALEQFESVLSGVFEYENHVLKKYTWPQMLSDKFISNAAGLYIKNGGNDEFITISKALRSTKGDDEDAFYNTVNVSDHINNYLEKTLEPIKNGELAFTTAETKRLIENSSSPFYDRFMLINPSRVLDRVRANRSNITETRWIDQFEEFPLNVDNASKYGFRVSDNEYSHIYILKKDQNALTSEDIAAARAFLAPKYNATLSDEKVVEILTRMGRDNRSPISEYDKENLGNDAAVINKDYIGTRNTENVYRINTGSLAEIGSSITSFGTSYGIKLDSATILELANDTKLRDISNIDPHYTLDQIINVARENSDYDNDFTLEYAEVVEKSARYNYLGTTDLENKVLTIHDRTQANNRSKYVVVIKENHDEN